MDRYFFRSVMGERPALWQAMLAFNGICAAEEAQDAAALPAVAGLTAEQTAALWHCPALRRALRLANPASGSNAASQRDGLKPFWDFAEEPRRLALLPGAALTRLTLVFGVAAHAAPVAQVVVRADRQFLQQELGEDMLLYALQRGRFQMTTPPADYAPEGEGGARPLPAPLQARVLPQRIRDYGLWALHRLRADWPEELRARRSFAPEPAALAHVRAYPGLWNDVKKILLKEVAPAWTPCFD